MCCMMTLVLTCDIYSRDRNLQAAGPVTLAVVSLGHFTRCVWSKLTERHMHMGGVILLMWRLISSSARHNSSSDATGKPLIREECTDFATVPK